MRNKKLLLASAALILTLGLAACNTGGKTDPSKEDTTSEQESGSTSQVDPVRLITVTAPDTVIVGQQFDLDDYVVVDGGEGPKVFDVTVPAASAELVQVEGHKVTALAEGEFSLQITAGNERAAFRSTAMSALKAAFAEATAELGNTWGLYELYEGQLYLGAVHRPDYTCFPGWGDNNEAGGFLKAQNGNTYSYTLDDNMEVVTAEPEIMSKFENYYCNYEWALSASDFNTVEVEDEEGNVSYKLEMSGDIPGSWGSSYFSNKIAEFAYTLAQSLNAKYTFSKLTVLPYTLGEGEEAVETFQFDLDIVAVATPETVVATYSYVLEPDNEALEVEAVRTYIDEGNFPEALAFDEIPTSIATFADAKAYTVNIEGYFYNPTTGDAIDTPTTWLKYFPVGQETDYVNATTVYREVVVGEEKAVFGDIEKDGQLYSFTNVADGAVGDTLNATVVADATSVWVDAISHTLGAANDETLFAEFVAAGRVENEDGSVTISATSDTCGGLLAAIANTSYLGEDIVYYAEKIGTEDANIIELGYIDLEFTVSANQLDVFIGITYNSTSAWGFEMSFTNPGVDAVPADVDSIVYPA